MYILSVTVCKDKKLAAEIKEHFAAIVTEGKRFFDPPMVKLAVPKKGDALDDDAGGASDDAKTGSSSGSEAPAP